MTEASALGPRSNALQHLRRLSGRRRARLEAGEFVIDGPTLIGEALDAGLEIRAIYAEPGASVQLLDRAAAAGVSVQPVTAGSLGKVTNPVTPQHVAAVAAIPTPDPAVATSGFVLVLVGVGDPGNAGTLVRVAEASGATAVVSCADAVDLWNPKCVRAAAGSLFRVPVLIADDPMAVVTTLRSAGMTVVASALRADVSLDEADLLGNTALLLGEEAHGLSDEVVDAADLTVSIPMAGRVESLNVAMAGTVVAFEAARQRRGNRHRAGEAPPST